MLRSQMLAVSILTKLALAAAVSIRAKMRRYRLALCETWDRKTFAPSQDQRRRRIDRLRLNRLTLLLLSTRILLISTAPIRFVSKLKIQNAVIETKKMCPPGSSRNCYDLTSRRITCEFSFAINGFTAGYSCPIGKYFDPVNFEITYHESSMEQPQWDAARRGDYAIDKCRLLAGSVAQVSVCKRR